MHLRELYRAMAERDDVEIDLLTSGPGEGSEEYMGYTRHLSDKLVCRKPIGPNMNAYRLADWQLAKTLARLLAEGKRWDVVHVHEWNSVEMGRMVRDALNIPMIGTMHLCLTKLAMYPELCPTDNPDMVNEEWIYMLQQEAHLIVDTDELILCSEAYEKTARELFMTRRPVHVVYNGIRTDEWKPGAGAPLRARAKHNLPPKDICLFVGRIADMKGVRPLLQAIEDIAYGLVPDPGYCFVLCGEVNADTDEQADSWEVTKQLKHLETFAPSLLRWVKFQHGQDLLDLYECAAVGMMPSVHEPFGIVALEHMAMGTPLIATEVDGLAEIVADGEGDENEYALIIPPGSPGAIVAALEQLKKKEHRETLREQGLRRVRDFDWFEIAEQTVGVYNWAVRRQRAGFTEQSQKQRRADGDANRRAEDREQRGSGTALD